MVLAPETTLECRISWAYKRASTAMLITSLTTALAFASNWVNRVLPVCLFGEFMFLLIMANYVLVVTMFPAVVVLSHLLFDGLSWHVPLPLPLVGVFAAIGLAAGGDSAAASVVLILGLGLVVASLHHTEEKRALLPFLQPFVAKVVGSGGEQSEAGDGNKPQLRWIETWYQDVASAAVLRIKKPLFVGFSLATVVVFFAFSIRMERATELVRLWQPDSMFERYSDIKVEAWPDRQRVAGRYGCEPDCQDVYFVFGVKAADTGNIFVKPADQYENGDLGEIVRDRDFALSTESQCWLQHFTDAVRASAPLISTMASENKVAYQPTPLETARLHGGCEWGDEFESCFVDWARRERPPTVFFEGDEVAAVAFVFHSTLRGDDVGAWDYPHQKKNWDALEAFMVAQLLSAPPGLASGWFHAREFVLTDMQQWMFIACWESAGISILVAYIVLLAATRDWTLTAIAIASILVILTWVLAALVALGWSMNVIESMDMAIAVGICVDFICHHTHSYHHGHGDRHARVKFSLTEMGITTGSAFLTTFSASSVLAGFTHVTIFSKFGVFLIVCMSFSIVVTQTFFHASLAMFGPTDFARPVGQAVLDRLRGREPARADVVGQKQADNRDIPRLSDEVPAVKVDTTRLKAVVSAMVAVLTVSIVGVMIFSDSVLEPGSAYDAAAVCNGICMSGYEIRGECVPVGVSPLQHYVELEDPAYGYVETGQRFRLTEDLHGSALSHAVSVTVLNMTSQSWLTPADSSQPIWWHLMVVCVPGNLDTSLDTAFLYVTGGSNGNHEQRISEDDDEVVMMADMAQQTATVHVLLKHVPNERISFPADHSGIYPDGRSEDAIIAFTWMRFVLEDPTHPEVLARFPMTKAVSRAMDTITSFMASRADPVTINDFVVAGASKRGWTTWSVGCVEPRVKAIVPIVMDLLNLVNVK